MVSQNSLMDHPDIVVQFNARVAPASHRDKPTYKENTAPGNERRKQVKKPTLVKVISSAGVESQQRREPKQAAASESWSGAEQRVSNIRQVSEPEETGKIAEVEGCFQNK